VIKTINGEKITDPNKLQEKVESTPIGTMLPLEVSRNGKSVDVEVKVGSFPTKQG
jgi:S1-C subfamily serine protease